MHALAVALLVTQTSAGFGADPRAFQTRLANQVAAAFDSARGGFVTKSQYPAESAVELALVQAPQSGEWRRRAEITLRWTHGLMDTLTGGYLSSGAPLEAEYGTSDKRADLNGRRLELLVEAWRLTGDNVYRRDAARVIDWAERILLDGRGGFVATQIGDRELVPAANGPILHAWLTWAAATHDSRRKNFALLSLDRVWDECWVDKLGLVHKNEMGDVDQEPRLVDQVEMGRAYVLAARLCGRPEDAQHAKTLGDLLLERFQEPGGALRTQSMPNKNGSIRKSGARAPENARAARFLCELAELTQDARYRTAAGRATASFTKEIGKADLEAADWSLAVRASYDADLPQRASWVAEVKDDDPLPRRRSVRFKAGH
jgi:uncharacterized protein YyaL (SSP411 family)